jgi:hypothetical protein
MNLDEFRQSLIATAPPAGLTLTLAGLWCDGKGDWAAGRSSGKPNKTLAGQTESIGADPSITL